MKKIRDGVVGLGHRGRAMFKLSADGFDYVEPAAACDIRPENWYEKQWLSDAPLAKMFPNAVFYESYDQMLKEADLDVVIVETGADIHAIGDAGLTGMSVPEDIYQMAITTKGRRLTWKRMAGGHR